MRVNVYDHDLTGCVKLETETSREGVVFKGIRFLFHPEIIHTKRGKQVDNDTPGVTFWLNQDATPQERQLLITSFAKALRLLGVEELPPESTYPEVEFQKMRYEKSIA